jgi:hypothetical protein
LQARSILEEAFQKKITESSFCRFCERHTDLFTSRIITSLGNKRLDDGIYESSLQYAAQLSDFHQKKKFSAKTIINYDETRIVASVSNKWVIRRLVSRQKPKPQHRIPIAKSHCATFLPFLAADGTLIACYFVIPAKFDDEEIGISTIHLEKGTTHNLRKDIYYKMFQTETGYLNDEIFQKICKDFF